MPCPENGLTGEVEAVEISDTRLFSASNETGERIVTAPIEAGDYKASITLGEGNGAATANVTYSIIIKQYPVWGKIR